MTNLKQHIKEINRDFTNVMYSKYLDGAWGIEAGYSQVPYTTVIMQKEIADWQLLSDCSGSLCALSTSGTTVITSYPTWGNSPFPQPYDSWSCPEIAPGINNRTVTPQTVEIVIPPFVVVQYTVGATGGPIASTFSFTPLDINGDAYLIGTTTIEVAVGTILTLGVDYTFNIATGTITLQLGRVFNTGEVYTITSFTV